jgi:hypothetical protein
LYRFAIAGTPFEPIAEMDRAEFVLVAAPAPVGAHRDNGDLLR